MTSASMMEVNPDIPECHALRGWFDAGGNSATYGCSAIWTDSRTSDETQDPYSDLRDDIDSLLEDLMDAYLNIDG